MEGCITISQKYMIYRYINIYINIYIYIYLYVLKCIWCTWIKKFNATTKGVEPDFFWQGVAGSSLISPIYILSLMQSHICMYNHKYPLYTPYIPYMNLNNLHNPKYPL